MMWLAHINARNNHALMSASHPAAAWLVLAAAGRA